MRIITIIIILNLNNNLIYNSGFRSRDSNSILRKKFDLQIEFSSPDTLSLI